MPNITINGYRFAVDLIVFDKDGTLIDLHTLWGQRTRRCADWLCERLSADAALRGALYQTLGYDPARGLILADSPMATIPRSQLVLVTATVLYQQGTPWHQAHEFALEAFQQTMTVAPRLGDLTPVGDVAALFGRLRAAGIQIALATSDDRHPTEATLQLLNVHNDVGAMVCGDDPLPSKPAPDAIWHLAKTFGVTADRVMMVGDTDCDMQTGLNAGVGCCLGVLSGACEAAVLARYTATIAESIHAIRLD